MLSIVLTKDLNNRKISILDSPRGYSANGVIIPFLEPPKDQKNFMFSSLQTLSKTLNIKSNNKFTLFSNLHTTTVRKKTHKTK